MSESLVCVSDLGYEGRLTIGKVYRYSAKSRVDDSLFYYHMLDDFGRWCMVRTSVFLSIEDYRDIKLKELGI